MRIFLHRESGFATVAISIALLVGASILTLYSTKSAIAEQRVATNDYRVKIAFEAADGGLQKGIAFLNQNYDTITVDNDNDGYMDAYSNPAVNNVTLNNGATFNVTYNNVTAGDLSIIEITSVGTTPDGTVTRTVVERYKTDPIISNSPTVPFTAKGNVTMSGNLTISNNHSDQSMVAGGAVSFAGSASTSTPGYSSDRNGLEADVTQNDAAMAAMTSDQFFQSYFGGSKTSMKKKANIKLSGTNGANYSDNLDGVTGKVIWVDQQSGTGHINSNTTVGSPDEPVVLFIDGNVQLNGTLTVYGIVYVSNDWNNSGGGTLDVQGTTIIEGNFSGTGTPNVNYQPDILTILEGYKGTFGSVPGSWRDF